MAGRPEVVHVRHFVGVDEREVGMRKFLANHAAATTGTLSCFDRLLFKGHLPLGYPHAMEVFLTLRGVLFKDLKAFVLKQADRLKAHAQAMAECYARTTSPTCS